MGRFVWLAVLLCGCSQGPEVAPEPSTVADPFAGGALFRDVETYAGFGVHQTASVGDLETSSWIADSLRTTGHDVAIQSWRLRQFAPTACELSVEGEAIPAFPYWFPKSTGAEGVSGPLEVLPEDPADDALAGKVAFVDGDNLGVNLWTAGVNGLAEKASKAGAVALVVVLRTPPGLLAGINARAPFHQEPLPLPAVVVPLTVEARLREAVGDSATLVLTGQDVRDATAQNVVMTIDRGPKWIVVTTPTSGWFQCSGERGPGVALFLALARWAAAQDGGPSWLFMANAGHELDNMGAHTTMDAFAPPPDDVACWIHLGASIATRQWEAEDDGSFRAMDAPRDDGNLVATEDVLSLVKDAFEDVSWLKPRSGEPILGELRHFIDGGYTAFGFFGFHQYFHTPKDTPENTSPELLERVGRALERAAEALVTGQ